MQFANCKKYAIFLHVSHPEKGYKQRGHLCYVHIGLRLITCVCLSPLLTLRFTFILCRKYYLLVKPS